MVGDAADNVEATVTDDRLHPSLSGNETGPKDASEIWQYHPLDPAVVGELAYALYPRGSCMYAVFGSVITQLATEVGMPFRAFPLDMMRYGASGVGGWGSVCGVINGCAALIGLFHSDKDDGQRNELIADMCLWYESSVLPQYEPAQSANTASVVTSMAGSILCHVSVSQWCRASHCDAESPERRERCRRLSAEGAMRVVTLLNGEASSLEFPDFMPETQSCIDCHGKTGRVDPVGKMQCGSCHQFESKHP
jgi:hypothetical protein